jgi:PilZ domain
MVWGDRKNTRVSFERAMDAVIMGIDGTWRRDCKLADVSASGARLIVSGALKGLNIKEFFLLLTPRGLAFRRCELVRVNGEEIGVRFLTAREIRGKQRQRLISAPPSSK